MGLRNFHTPPGSEPIATRFAIHVGLTSAFGICTCEKVDAPFSREADGHPGSPRNRITCIMTLPTSSGGSMAGALPLILI